MGALKLKKYLSKRSKLYYKYLLSYIMIVVIILLGISSVVYGNLITKLQNDVEASNIAALSQLRDTVDQRLKELEGMSFKIAANPRLSPFFVNSGGYGYYQAYQELNTYISTNSFISDMGIFYTNKDYSGRLFTTRGFYDTNIFFERIYRFQNWGKDGFINDVSSLRSPVMRPMEHVLIDGTKDTNLITYLYPFPVNAEKPASILVYFISTDTLESMVRNILKNDQGYVLILNDKYEPIVDLSSTGNFEETSGIIGTIKHKSPDVMLTSDTLYGKRFSTIHVKSNYNGWHYVRSVQYNLFMEKIFQSRKVFNVMAGAALLVGIIFAFIFSSRNYMPVREIFDQLPLLGSKPAKISNTDELSFISNMISEAGKERQGLLHRLKSQSTLVREQYLLKLIQGRLNDLDEMDKIWECTGFHRETRHFNVMLFSIDDYEDFIKKNEKPMQCLLKFSIVNVIEELSLELGQGVGIDLIDESSIVLVLALKDEKADQDKIYTIGYKAKEFFKQHFQFTLTVGIGSTYESLNMVPLSYDEAKSAVYHRLVKGKDRIILFKEICNSPTYEYSYPTELEVQLIQAIKQGKVVEVEEILDCMIGTLAHYNYTMETIQCICSGIINTIVKTMYELNIVPDENIRGIIRHISNIKLQTLDSIGDFMKEVCRNQCELITQRKESKNFQLREEIIEFIDKNYYDQTLCLESLAEKFNLTPNYITRYFKDQTGQSLMRYIDSIRMEKAKELLKDSDIAISRIIEQVGYVDQANFIRKFKKIEGITPSEYRSKTMLVRESS